MSAIEVTYKKNFKSAAMAKQIPFAVAQALTWTAQDAQKEVIDALHSTFTLRGSWWKPRTKFGINIRPAKKTHHVAYVGTNAPWLEIHEEGGTKKPKGKMLAIPTENIRKKPTQRIGLKKIAKNLQRTFIVNTPSGPVMMQRKGRGRKMAPHPETGRIIDKNLTAVYVLEPTATIEKNSTVFEPTERAVMKNWERNFYRSMIKALEPKK